MKAAVTSCISLECQQYAEEAITFFSSVHAVIRTANQIPSTWGTTTPPGIASAWGDPHFTTFDGCYYTFNGVGEFILLQVGSGNTMDFLAQVRTAPVAIYPASMASAVSDETFLLIKFLLVRLLFKQNHLDLVLACMLLLSMQMSGLMAKI